MTEVNQRVRNHRIPARPHLHGEPTALRLGHSARTLTDRSGWTRAASPGGWCGASSGSRFPACSSFPVTRWSGASSGPGRRSRPVERIFEAAETGGGPARGGSAGRLLSLEGRRPRAEAADTPALDTHEVTETAHVPTDREGIHALTAWRAHNRGEAVETRLEELQQLSVGRTAVDDPGGNALLWSLGTLAYQLLHTVRSRTLTGSWRGTPRSTPERARPEERCVSAASRGAGSRLPNARNDGIRLHEASWRARVRESSPASPYVVSREGPGFDHHRLRGPIGHVPPAEYEDELLDVGEAAQRRQDSQKSVSDNPGAVQIMPGVGVEPTRALAHAILSRTRMPIPPPRPAIPNYARGTLATGISPTGRRGHVR